MKKKIIYNNREYIIEAKGKDEIVVNNKTFKVNLREKNKNFFNIEIQGKKFIIEVRDGEFYLDGEKIEKLSVSPYFPQLKKQKQMINSQKEVVKAPIPGTITQILVKEGDTVEKDQELFILEAMKMRNRILVNIDKGVVKKIFVSENETVVQDQKLATIEN
ncbi:MAG: biotin/lipoyl-binding protein [Candidatus Heimdallarchaeum endolithica]|uniref:Biotin/lipoyl-binding protein n=1 Tax=Candidatus Heimdallarchaeum endolithica TaxID=2876572 RepID=A0A9Y1BRS7_9ARCH|nr:MAG: biotin/lipoyl-binding protein [Candidatus Heimdallarchaeum endolithica]